MENEPCRLLVALARRAYAPLCADRLQHGRKPRRDDHLGRRPCDQGRDAPDRHRVEQRRSQVERRRGEDLLPLGPQRLDAGMGNDARRRQRQTALGIRQGRRRLRHQSPRRQGVVRTARRGLRPQVVGRLQGHGQIEGPHLRRPDGPPLELLGRGFLPAYLRRRLRSRGAEARRGHHRQGRRVGRSAGTLLRHGRNRVEQRRNDAGVHLQAADRHRVRRFDRFGHLRLRPRKRRDAEHLQTRKRQYRRTDRGHGHDGGLRQIPRLVARRPADRVPLAVPATSRTRRACSSTTARRPKCRT